MRLSAFCVYRNRRPQAALLVRGDVLKMLRAVIPGPLAEYESPEHRYAHCMEALRVRVLSVVSPLNRLAIYNEALVAGWGFYETWRAVDALVIERDRDAEANNTVQ